MTMQTVLDALRDALGDAVSTTDAVLADARSDKSGHVSDAPPIAVVSARSIEDVQTVMKTESTQQLIAFCQRFGTCTAYT